MNVDTGAVYRGESAIQAAVDRGEPIVPVSERVAYMMELGRKALARQESPLILPTEIHDLEGRIKVLEEKLEIDQRFQRLEAMGLVRPEKSPSM